MLLAVLDEIDVRYDPRILLVCGHLVVPVPIVEVVFYRDLLRDGRWLVSPLGVVYSVLSVKVIVKSSILQVSEVFLAPE